MVISKTDCVYVLKIVSASRRLARLLKGSVPCLVFDDPACKPVSSHSAGHVCSWYAVGVGGLEKRRLFMLMVVETGRNGGRRWWRTDLMKAGSGWLFVVVGGVWLGMLL